MRAERSHIIFVTFKGVVGLPFERVIHLNYVTEYLPHVFSCYLLRWDAHSSVQSAFQYTCPPHGNKTILTYSHCRGQEISNTFSYLPCGLTDMPCRIGSLCTSWEMLHKYYGEVILYMIIDGEILHTLTVTSCCDIDTSALQQIKPCRCLAVFTQRS